MPKRIPHWPVTVFYDHACDICRTLMQKYKKQDTKDRLTLIDISDPHFQAKKYALDPELVRVYLYAIDNHGQVVRGVDSFVWIWKAIGKNLRASLLSWPLIRVIAQPFYRLFSRYRYIFNRQERDRREKCQGACKWQQL